MSKISLSINNIITIILTVAVIVILIWLFNLNRLQEEEDHNVSEIIGKVIEEKASEGLILPELIFLNLNNQNEEDLKKEVVRDIKNKLLEVYTTDNDRSPTDVDSYFLLPKDEYLDGEFIITDEQLERIDRNILFLTRQIDSQVRSSKDEIRKSIDKLNLWISIWLGVIGFIGIFVPLLVNFDAVGKINTAKEEFDELHDQLSNVSGRTDLALTGTQSSQFNLLVNRLSRRINRIDNFKERQRVSVIKDSLIAIKESLEECIEKPDHKLTKFGIVDLGHEVSILSKHSIFNEPQITKFTDLLEIITSSESKDSGISEEYIKSIVEGIDQAVVVLKD